MFFRRRRRASGVSLTSLILIGAGLYATGAGAWLTSRIEQIPNACYQGISGQQALCAGTEKVSNAVVAFATRTGGFLDGVIGRTHSGVSGGDASLNFADYGTSMQSSNISGLRLPDWSQLNLRQLSAQLNLQPDISLSSSSVRFSPNTSGTDALKAALERYVLGNQFANPASVNFSPQQSIRLHTQGAQLGAYGFGSQVALGNAYSQGWGGESNAALAERYLSQAVTSLNNLASSNDPQAKAYLQSFGSSPDAMREQLIQQIRAIKSQQ